MACETLVTTGMAIDRRRNHHQRAASTIPDIVRNTIKEIGYNDSAMGFDCETCAVLTSIDRQSPDISQGVDRRRGAVKEQGAGDQGMMFGYACDETPELMPMPIMLRPQADQAPRRWCARTTCLPFLRPDGKSQVTIEYINGKPVRVDTVVISTQHAPDVTLQGHSRKAIIEEVIKQGDPGRPDG